MQICGKKYMNKKVKKSSDIIKLKEEISNLKKTLVNFYFQKSSGQLEKTSSIKKTKRDISRLKTRITEISGVKNA